VLNLPNWLTVTRIFLVPLVVVVILTKPQFRMAPAWMVVIVVGREFAVTGLRNIAISQGIAIGASIWGKYKTVSQVVAVVLLIVGRKYLGAYFFLGQVALWLVVILAVLSAADYFLKFSRRLGVVGGPPAASE
jgi:CDP-diacylglycerol--glycerol-3-phosphate 3-phosphatidyltransferase